jgi:hypothetical protein
MLASNRFKTLLALTGLAVALWVVFTAAWKSLTRSS